MKPRHARAQELSLKAFTDMPPGGRFPTDLQEWRSQAVRGACSLSGCCSSQFVAWVQESLSTILGRPVSPLESVWTALHAWHLGLCNVLDSSSGVASLRRCQPPAITSSSSTSACSCCGAEPTGIMMGQDGAKARSKLSSGSRPVGTPPCPPHDTELTRWSGATASSSLSLLVVK